MSNLLQTFEKKQIEKLTGKKRIPTFRTGDTLKVTIRITEGDKSRLQAFEGMCIARKNNSVNSNFTVRKLSHGEGVERVFPLFGPMIEKIEVVRKGDVRRAKLYYLRDRTGKKARIADRDRGDEADQYAMIEEDPVQELSSNESESSVETKQETANEVKEEKEVEAVQDKQEGESSEEPNVEEKKEEAPAEEAENKTDEKS
jgi:large subunit ribosomal protein L19